MGPFLILFLLDLLLRLDGDILEKNPENIDIFLIWLYEIFSPKKYDYAFKF
jgi:hypothetical protein